MRDNCSESIEDYYKIMEKLPVPICVFKVETHETTGIPTDVIFSFMNNRYENILPYSRAECIGKSFFQVFTNETDRTKWNYLHWNASHNGMINEYENYAPPLDKYFSIIVFPIVYGYCGSILWDITIEKKFSNLIWEYSPGIKDGENLLQAYNRYRKSNVRDMGAYNTTILYVNTKTGKFDTLKNRDVINSAEDEDYSLFMENMKAYLSDEDYGLFEETFSLEKIRQNSKSSTPMETELRINFNNAEGWVRIEGIFLSSLLDNDSGNFIISFKNIGEHRLKTLRLRNEHERRIKELTEKNRVYEDTIREIMSALDEKSVLKKKAEKLLGAM